MAAHHAPGGCERPGQSRVETPRLLLPDSLGGLTVGISGTSGDPQAPPALSIPPCERLEAACESDLSLTIHTVPSSGTFSGH